MARRFLIAPIAGLVLGLAGSAQALTISAVAIAKNGPNTANFKNDTTIPPDYREFNSTVAVADTGGTTPDVIGNSVDAKTRYAATTDADGGVATAPSQSATSDYKITFTVSAGGGVLYNVKIDTSRLGALTRVDDGTGGGTANIGAVTGKVNGVTNGTLAMAAVSLAQGTGAANTVISQTTATLTLFGLTGTNNITLDFAWTSLANSTCTGAFCSTTGNDEMAVRLGVADTTSGSSAGDYPGVGSRTIGNDGHLVTITAVATTPEPGTALLMGLGLSGLGIFGRRKKA
jgi:hypothetical protein